MSEVTERFVLLIKELGISKAELARITGASKEWAGQVFNGEIKNIGLDKVEKLCAYNPNINLEWLVKNEGEKLLDELDEPKNKELGESESEYKKENKHLKEKITLLEKQITLLEENMSLKNQVNRKTKE